MLEACDWNSLYEIETSFEKLSPISESQKQAGKLLAQEIFSIENNAKGILKIVTKYAD